MQVHNATRGQRFVCNRPEPTQVFFCEGLARVVKLILFVENGETNVTFSSGGKTLPGKFKLKAASVVEVEKADLEQWPILGAGQPLKLEMSRPEIVQGMLLWERHCKGDD
jgi:hypothetical protein